MKQLQILMPMAGLGLRFKNSGISLLKPLIEVQGEPMFKKALGSIPLEEFECKIIFVVKKIDEQEFHLTSQFHKYSPRAEIVVIDHMTRGALETCYQAKTKICSDLPLLILDCDLQFTSKSFFDFLKNEQLGDVAGALVSFSSDHPRYSYAKIENGDVVCTAEKKVISNNALAGAYYFSQASFFFGEAENVLNEKKSAVDEYPFYISPIYNKLISKNYKVKLFSTDTYFSFGTPEELALVNHE